MNFNEVSSKYAPYHDALNPILWQGNELKTEIRYKLLYIARHFASFLHVDKLNLRDITISGSNAAYGYSSNSDLDLHLIVDIPSDNPDLQQLYDAKKNQYNAKYGITIKDIPVELYVQDSNQKHISAGIFSVLHDEWIHVPKHEIPRVTDQEIKSKARNYAGQITQALKSDNIHIAKNALADIKRLRMAGLSAGGEFSVENLAYKLLRSKGQINKLQRHIDRLESADLSMKERYEN